MRKIKNIPVCLVLLLTALLVAMPATAAAGEMPPVNVKKILFDHVKDRYEWHITSIGEQEIVIPLPVILYSSRAGWNIVPSSVFRENGQYNGFYVAAEGDNEGKIVERDATGREVRPFDISLTKTALSLLINSLLLILIILGVARWYRGKKVSDKAPRGFVGMMEMFVMMVNDDIIKCNVGKDYRRYAPYLLTAFFFIFFNNLMGILPIFPGGANVTGNIAITFFLALCTFIAVNVFGTREYWKEIFWPDVPAWLKVPVPLLPFVEFFGIFTKPFALMIRLFANIFAGHTAILAFMCVIFITASMGPALCGSMSVVSVLLSIFMNALEFLVAFIQAYVFTLLSSVFIGLSRVEHKK